MKLSIVVACRRSPARLEGATTPIATVEVAPSRELRLWDPQARTLRFHRDLAGIVTLVTTQRWADYAIEYAALIAHAYEGIVAVAGEILGEIDPAPDAPLSERDLAFAWRSLDFRTQSALEAYDHAMRLRHLAVVSALDLTPTSRPLD